MNEWMGIIFVQTAKTDKNELTMSFENEFFLLILMSIEWHVKWYFPSIEGFCSVTYVWHCWNSLDDKKLVFIENFRGDILK